MSLIDTMVPTTIQDNAGRLQSQQFEQAALAVTTAASPSQEIHLNGRFGRTAIELTNTVALALASCKVQAKVHPNGAWFDWVTSAELNTGTAIAGRLVQVVGNPTTLNNAVSNFILDTTALWAIRLNLTAASTATVTVRANAGSA
jgi:hypothetical protein